MTDSGGSRSPSTILLVASVQLASDAPQPLLQVLPRGSRTPVLVKHLQRL